jgi:hypothetical protein
MFDENGFCFAFLEDGYGDEILEVVHLQRSW